MSETSDSDHWFHRVSTEIQRWLASEPSSALTQTAAEAIIGAGGVPVRDQTTDALHLPEGDQAYIQELCRAGLEGDEQVR